MKKITLLFAFIAFSLTSCSSDEPGPPGPPGEPGINILGQTFGDLTARSFDFDSDFNLYNHYFEIPADVEVFESDAILAYRLEVIGDVETWSLLPKSYFLNDGRIIQYSFNHTDEDVEIVITGNFDLATLDEDYLQNQYFKFVVVPSEFVDEMSIDFSDHDAVMQALDLK
ncbi:hypothetical protein [Salinimicrobium terrae]|uniref:hypothetical protein n=1 Tax=Salinimicrobium terrae TaxID=470866 RepID=UPI0003F9784E|nr:hypothetical protein [Salinimicrobium terrae]